MPEQTNWKELKICMDSMEAQLIRGLLESEDIPVQMDNINMHDLLPGVGLINIKILVPEEYFEKAEKLVREFYDGQ